MSTSSQSTIKDRQSFYEKKKKKHSPTSGLSSSAHQIAPGNLMQTQLS